MLATCGKTLYSPHIVEHILCQCGGTFKIRYNDEDNEQKSWVEWRISATVCCEVRVCWVEGSPDK